MANTSGKTLGDVLREARVAADVSLRTLAAELKITPSYISDIENDRRVPSEEVLRQLADHFRLKFDDLMALAGRVGEDAERHLRREPAVGHLFRRIAEKRLGREDVQKLIDQVERMKKKEAP